MCAMADRFGSVQHWLAEIRYSTESYGHGGREFTLKHAVIRTSAQMCEMQWHDGVEELQVDDLRELACRAVAWPRDRNALAQCQWKLELLAACADEQQDERGTRPDLTVQCVFSQVAAAAPDEECREVQLREAGGAGGRTAGRSKTCFLYPGAWPPSPGLTVIKEGPMDRVKITAAGKKLPRHWRPKYACLTDKGLFFAEDSHVLLAMKSGGGPADAERVDLRGARLSRDATEHSAKRNVIAIVSTDGRLTLVQNDNPDKAEAWWDQIGAVVEQHRPWDAATVDLKRSALRRFFMRRPTRESLEHKGIYRDEPVFGSSLERLYEAAGGDVPQFVRLCMEKLEGPEHIDSVGLYRIPGNLSRIQGLRLQVDQNQLHVLNTVEDSDVLAGALKLFFRELREPLLPFRAYADLLAAITEGARTGDPVPAARTRSRVKEVLAAGLGAPAHLHTLKALCTHLVRVCRHEPQNQMSAGNMAIVWGPSLTWPLGETSQELMLQCTSVNQVVEYLIAQGHLLF